jgi:hypothetical protein
MSFILSSWRRVAVVCLVALAGTLVVTALPSADAQQPPPTEVGVLSNFAVAASNGFSNLPEFSGSGDGVVGVACTGATPRSGTINIPGQVVTELRSDLTYLRIIRPDGVALTGNVRINCVVEVVATPEGSATLRQLEQVAAR